MFSLPEDEPYLHRKWVLFHVVSPCSHGNNNGYALLKVVSCTSQETHAAKMQFSVHFNFSFSTEGRKT